MSMSTTNLHDQRIRQSSRIARITTTLASLPMCILVFLPCGCESTKGLQRLTDENRGLRQSLADAKKENIAIRDELVVVAEKDTASQRILELRRLIDAMEAKLNLASKDLWQCESENTKLREQVTASSNELSRIRQENDQLRQLATEVNLQLTRTASVEWKWAQFLQGAKVIAQDHSNTFLGVIDFNGLAPDSVFNEVGLHGSNVGIHSIWSDVGLYGSSIGVHSARNSLSVSPPVLVKGDEIVGYLTINSFFPRKPKCDPYYLRDLWRRINGKIGIEY